MIGYVLDVLACQHKYGTFIRRSWLSSMAPEAQGISLCYPMRQASNPLTKFVCAKRGGSCGCWLAEHVLARCRSAAAAALRRARLSAIPGLLGFPCKEKPSSSLQPRISLCAFEMPTGKEAVFWRQEKGKLLVPCKALGFKLVRGRSEENM